MEQDSTINSMEDVDSAFAVSSMPDRRINASYSLCEKVPPYPDVIGGAGVEADAGAETETVEGVEVR